MSPNQMKISNAFQFGLLGGLGVLTAIAIGNAFLTLANVVTYVALAIFIALGIEPVVQFLERKLNLRRPLAITGVVAIMAAFLATIIWSLLPAVTEQTAHFINSAPDLLNGIKSVELVDSLDRQFGDHHIALGRCKAEALAGGVGLDVGKELPGGLVGGLHGRGWLKVDDQGVGSKGHAATVHLFCQ